MFGINKPRCFDVYIVPLSVFCVIQRASTSMAQDRHCRGGVQVQKTTEGCSDPLAKGVSLVGGDTPASSSSFQQGPKIIRMYRPSEVPRAQIPRRVQSLQILYFPRNGQHIEPNFTQKIGPCIPTFRRVGQGQPLDQEKKFPQGTGGKWESQRSDTCGKDRGRQKQLLLGCNFTGHSRTPGDNWPPPRPAI